MADPTIKANPLHKMSPPADPHTAAPPVPKCETKPWLPELSSQTKDPIERDAKVAVLLAGRPLKVPANWITMSLEAKAAYLDEKYPIEVKQ